MSLLPEDNTIVASGALGRNFNSERRWGPLARSGGRSLLPNQVLDRFKYEVADELGLSGRIQERGWPDMPSRDCGKIGGRIGGNMVRVMIRYAEEALGKGETIE
jgi:hypothetical protein